MADFRKQFQELIEKSYIPTNADKIVMSNVWNNIHKLIIPNIPEKLFRYRKIDKYSLEELREGKMWLCHAGMFPDKYDSYLYINHHKVRKDLKDAIRNALRVCLMYISPSISNMNSEKVAQVCSYRERGFTDEQIIDIMLHEEEDICEIVNQIDDTIKGQESRFRRPRNTAKIGCFTECVQSKYMWDRYGGGYKGFALEYDLRNSTFEYSKRSLNVNLFPIIYSDFRLDVTSEESNIYAYEYMKRFGDKNWLPFANSILSVNQLYWYKAYLYKDRKEYEHEHEWRILYYNLDNEDDYESIPDAGCLKAIYYGPDIKDSDKEELHKIAMQRGLKEYNISLDSESPKYDLKISSLE